MRKIVINVTHGGLFGLNDQGIELYAKLKGLNLQKEGRNYYIDGDKEKRFYYHRLERDDPILVEVVEKLGELCHDRLSKLKIVKIPENVKWTIEEYDGLEHVAEQHQTWHYCSSDEE